MRWVLGHWVSDGVLFFVFWVPNLQVFKVFSTRANESGGGGGTFPCERESANRQVLGAVAPGPAAGRLRRGHWNLRPVAQNR